MNQDAGDMNLGVGKNMGARVCGGRHPGRSPVNNWYIHTRKP
jgi:hypothetical protein